MDLMDFLLVAISILGISEGAKQFKLPPISHTVFPEGFIFGAATSAYQIEGGWDADGKGQTIWDNITHERPSFIADRTNGDVAADSYHRYKEDVQLLQNIGFQMYRFSFSWPRILPNGRVNNVNQAGIDYYMNLIDELLAKGIQPMGTLYHWELPQDLEDIGGWTNPEIVNIFQEYADLVFKTYGHKVKWWLTINEPSMAALGYGGETFAPAAYENLTGVVEYQVGRNMLLAHAGAYRLYKRKYIHQNGKLSMVFGGLFCIPKTDHLEDRKAAERCFQNTYGWFGHPIFIGDYPPEMRKTIDELSRREHRNTSRLPYLTQDEIAYIKGTADYYGLSQYTTYLASDEASDKSNVDPDIAYPKFFRRRLMKDTGVLFSSDPSWPAESLYLYKVVPQGIRLHVKKICEEYGNPEIIVVENGYSEDGSNFTHDPGRIYFLETYLGELRESIYTDGCNVRGHITYSFLDSFEWKGGYMDKFGLVSVDFNNPNRTRTMKNSAHWMRNYIEMHKIYYQ